MDWIDVKERLPEFHQPVAVRLFCDAMPRIAVLIRTKVFDAKGEEVIHTKWGGICNVRVTHWFPLPDYPNSHLAHRQVH